MLPWWFIHNIAITVMQWDSGSLQTNQSNAIKIITTKHVLKTLRKDAGKQQREKNNDSGFLRIKVTDTSGK